MAIPDGMWQDMSTVASEQMPNPPTLASASTIAPSSFLTMVSGTTAIATITPPLPKARHMLALVFTNANPAAFTGAGNVASTKDPAQNELVLMVYNPLTETYYVVN